ncbi:helix-turn-helix domain-containing protein [Streptomyces sp. EN27]|uniref:helix-turn-helix domain-containing protein n=1 Tax=Streptomyces sp. EN27 TaxID=211464 RepID=UPI002108F73B|nr:helix-turn-helix domain-containing protein [Streptomyces sp. EN27]
MRRRTPGADTHQRVYRYRCYPTPAQADQLVKTFGACRWAYNEGLALRDKAWREHRVSFGCADSCRALTGWRNAEGTRWLQEVSSAVLPQALQHLDAAVGRCQKFGARLFLRGLPGRFRHPTGTDRTHERQVASRQVRVCGPDHSLLGSSGTFLPVEEKIHHGQCHVRQGVPRLPRLHEAGRGPARDRHRGR